MDARQSLYCCFSCKTRQYLQPVVRGFKFDLKSSAFVLSVQRSRLLHRIKLVGHVPYHLQHLRVPGRTLQRGHVEVQDAGSGEPTVPGAVPRASRVVHGKLQLSALR